MSGVARAVGAVAGVVATVAQFVPGGQVVAQIAGAISVVATVTSQLTAKAPATKGQINERLIGANNPQPYLMGRSYSGGLQVHDVGWGGEVSGVENPYRFMASVYSCCGPVESLESVQLDYNTASFSGTASTGYYADYLWRDFQLGARPESDSLSPQWSGTPDWGASYKLSGFAAIGFSFLWSKKGKRFAGGRLPVIGAIWEGVKVYDPRLDSTYPGGSGAHRIDDETTWAYSRNPALHALAYSYGRYVNGEKVFGADLGADAIDLASVVAWANVCDTNSWNVDGTIYEPGDKWNNLKRICEAGGGEPVLAGGMLRFDYQSPRTSLATIGKDDLAEGQVKSKLGKGWKNRHNTGVPRYRSEDHQWNYVQSDPVSVAAWVTADGEEKLLERQFDLVTNKDQAAELMLYDLYQRREAGPISLTCKPHMASYDPGDCLTLGADLGVHPDGAVKALVRRRTVDPLKGTVTFEFEVETDAKHTDALAATGTAPAIPSIPGLGDLDDIYGFNIEPDGFSRSLITTSSQDNTTITADDASITIGNHSRVYANETVSVTGTTLTTEDDGSTAIAATTLYYLYYDDADRVGGAVSWKATQNFFTAQNSETNPDRHYAGYITTDTSGGGGTTGGGSLPPGSGGVNPY